MQEKTVLVLGGGIGGVVAATRLSRILPRRHSVVVVDRETDFSLAASYIWIMSGARKSRQIIRPLSSLRRKGIDVVHGEVQSVDPARRRAIVGGNEIAADYLVVALGAEFAPDAVSGLSEHGDTFCTLAGAEILRGKISEMREGKSIVPTAAPAYKCPAAPYEAAMTLDGMFRKRRVRDSLSIELYSAEPGPMPVAGPDVSKALADMVRGKGIAYFPARQIEKAEDDAVWFNDGGKADFDLLIYVPPIRPPAALSDSELTDESGWVRVDRNSLETEFENVYALGDATLIPLTMGKPLPKAGVFAHGQAEVVAANIARKIHGGKPRLSFDGYGACFVEAGGGVAGFGAGNFYAEPAPNVRLRTPGWHWHAAKVLFEKQVMMSWL